MNIKIDYSPLWTKKIVKKSLFRTIFKCEQINSHPLTINLKNKITSKEQAN